MTCIEFGRAEIRTQVDAHFSPYGHPMQVDCKFITSQLYMREIYGLFAGRGQCIQERAQNFCRYGPAKAERAR